MIKTGTINTFVDIALPGLEIPCSTNHGLCMYDKLTITPSQNPYNFSF